MGHGLCHKWLLLPSFRHQIAAGGRAAFRRYGLEMRWIAVEVEEAAARTDGVEVYDSIFV